MFDVEIGAATAKLSKLSRKLDSVTDGMKKAGKSSADAKDATKDWSKGISTAVTSLLKYRAAMLGIETVTTSVKNAWDAIAERQKQAASRQISVGTKLSELASFISPDSDISAVEIAKIVRESKVGDQGLAADAIRQAVSSKASTQSVSSVVEGTMPVVQDLYMLKNDEDVAAIPAAVNRLIAAAGGMEHGGVSSEERFKAQTNALLQLTQESLATTQQDVVNNILPGVVSSMKQGLDQGFASASIAVAGTAAGDVHGKETSGTFAKAIKKVSAIAMEVAGVEEASSVGTGGIMKLLYGIGSEEDLKKLGGKGKLEQIRTRAIGLVGRSDKELDEVLASYDMEGAEWNQETLDTLKKKGVDIEGELPGRALAKVMVGRLLMGKSDMDMHSKFMVSQGRFGDLSTEEGIDAAVKAYEKKIVSMRDSAGLAVTETKEGKEHEEYNQMNDPAGAAHARREAVEKQLASQHATRSGMTGPLAFAEQMTDYTWRNYEYFFGNMISAGSPEMHRSITESVQRRYLTGDAKREYDKTAEFNMTGWMFGAVSDGVRKAVATGMTPQGGAGVSAFGELQKTVSDFMMTTKENSKGQREANEKLTNGVIKVEVVNPDTRPPAGVDSNRLNQGS